MGKVIVLDEGYIKHRAIFASIANESTPSTYMFLKMIIGYFKKIGLDADDTVIVAVDFGNWRKEVDISYKAQRKEAREQKKSPEWWKSTYNDFNELYKILDTALPWYFCKLWKAEADDWASGVCRYFTTKEIILVSSDADWQMLCSFSNVRIFSPMTKKYKIVENPMVVLMDKIHGDKSDNLLSVPSSEAEFDRRKKIVDLISPLPDFIEKPIIETFRAFMPKNLYIHKLPYRSLADEFKKLYNFDTKI